MWHGIFDVGRMLDVNVARIIHIRNVHEYGCDLDGRHRTFRNGNLIILAVIQDY